MRSLLMRSFVVAAAFALAQAGAPSAGAAGSDIGGDWHFRFDGSQGAAILHFPGTPQFGTFEVHGAGYTTLFPDQAFVVEDSATQTLAFDSRGNISGVIALEDPARTSALGELTVKRGTLSAAQDLVVLSGTLTLGGKAGARVRLVGRRFAPPSAPVTGRSFDGVLAGRGVRSSKYDVRVSNEGSVVGEGYPFLVLEAGGPARIDGVEVASSRIDGLLVAEARGTICGHVTSSDFGPAVLRGRIVTDPLLGVPAFRATIVATGGRRVRLSANLN